MTVDIDAELDHLAARLSDRLAHAGWARRRLGNGSVATFTRPGARGETMVVAELIRGSFSIPERWPAHLVVLLGAGYEPALDLMPLLTLRPEPALVRLEVASGARGRRVDLDGPADQERVIGVVAGFLESGGAAVDARFPDVAAIEAELTDPSPIAERDDTGDDTGDDTDDDTDDDEVDTRGIVSRLVLSVALGNADEARALLRCSGDELAVGDQRFVRQLRRRIDAGCAPAPPIEETLALLPSSPRSQRPSWSRTRAEQAARRAARDAVREVGRGRTVDELAGLLAAQYDARDLTVSPSRVRATAVALHDEYRPFGRLRNAITGIRTLVDATTGTVDAMRNLGREDPTWLRPPARAAYPIAHVPRTYLAVSLDPQLTNWLDRVYEASSRIATQASLDVWLTRTSDELVAHIGDRRVGVISAPDADRFEPAFVAAALFDEDPVARGRLVRFEGARFVLDVPMPAEGPAGGPGATGSMSD